MDIETLSHTFTKVFATNGTTAGTSITGKTPTTTEPTGDGVFSTRTKRGEFGNHAAFVFFGTSAANQTLLAKITGWQRVDITGTATLTLWMPVSLLYLTITLGAATGVASTLVAATDYIADTIVATTAYTSQYEIISPADDTVATVKVDFFGCQKLEVQLVRNGSSASTNCLARVF